MQFFDLAKASSANAWPETMQEVAITSAAKILAFIVFLFSGKKNKATAESPLSSNGRQTKVVDGPAGRRIAALGSAKLDATGVVATKPTTA
ncbi:MAG: hypothetical protein U1E84_02420 [Rhodoferax sp.]